MAHKLNNLTSKKIVIIIVFLAFLLSMRWVWFEVFSTSQPLSAKAGILDLRGIDLNRSASFQLNGDWEFYPGALLSAEEMQKQALSAAKLKVPGDWSGVLGKPDHSAYGYGTYRLRLLVDPLEQPVAFWLKGVQASSEVEINGVSSGASGQPASNKAEYTPRNVSYTASYYEKGTTELNLLIRVANFDDLNDGGIVKTVHFGNLDTITQERSHSSSFQLVTFAILMLHGLYACILFLLNRQEYELLMLSGLTLAVGVLIVSGYDQLLLQWLPINYTWAAKIRLLSFLWQNVMILLIFSKFSRPLRQHWGARIYSATLGVVSAIVLLAPASVVKGAFDSTLFLAFSLIPIGWFVYIAATMLVKKQSDKDAIFLLLTAISIISNLTWNFVGFPVSVYFPVDIIASFIGLSTYWFKKYYRHSQENALLNEQLTKTNQMKDQFLANTSHELKSPLHGIMNIAETVVVKEGARLGTESLKNMELLITISRRMSHMLGDLLDVVRLQEHRIAVQRQPLHIQAVVPAVMSMLSFMTEGKALRLQAEIAEATPPVLADEKRLIQVLYNLVHNAIKFTEKGIIAVSADVYDDHVVIRVSDTGVGMDEELQARVFLPYEQGPYSSSDGRGIGLGLSICRQLVELHGSSLKVVSEPGSGSVFSFELPLAGEAALQKRELPLLREHSYGGGKSGMEHSLMEAASAGLERSPEPPELLGGAQVHILAVDDDPVNLNVLKGILSTEPYTITAVHSAGEVLDLIDKRPWDLLIADVMMPAMSGYELTRKVREHHSVLELPVLLLTARSLPADIYTGFSAGANDYVTKPVDATELKYRIRALISSKQSLNERLRMEAAYLQAQIHPHFLFNTLNSIMALSHIDTDKMREVGETFASFLRISFDFLNTNELVELSHELKLVEAYLAIEKVRYEERLTVIWEVEAESNVLIPPLSIQPLIENAIKHGLMNQRKGGTVQIRIAQQLSATLIEVRDNGKGMEEKQIAELLSPTMRGKGGIGLANTNRRLRQLYGQGLSIASKLNEGTTVSFVIPSGAEASRN